MDEAAKALARAVALLRDRWPVLATVVQRSAPPPEDWLRLPEPVRLLLMVRTALAQQLRHPERRGGRDPRRWAAASRLVVDALLTAEGIPIPDAGASPSGSESVEAVYERLSPHAGVGPGDDAAPADDPGDGPPQALDPSDEPEEDEPGDEERWRRALEGARAPRRRGRGMHPGDERRDVERLPAHLDWRVVLWRFVARTPTDFAGFDRRFVGRGLYLDALDAEHLRVFAAVDTSSSIALPTLARFVAELEAIAGAYPHVRCTFFYADSAIHGPHELHRGSSLPAPVGGGGTDFRPFFAAVGAHRVPGEEAVVVYLTDGDGTFPRDPPELPTLWVRPPGGRPIDAFPFGRVVPLIEG